MILCPDFYPLHPFQKNSLIKGIGAKDSGGDRHKGILWDQLRGWTKFLALGVVCAADPGGASAYNLPAVVFAAAHAQELPAERVDHTGVGSVDIDRGSLLSGALGCFKFPYRDDGLVAVLRMIHRKLATIDA